MFRDGHTKTMINIPVSVGELVDKITILKIKLTQIKDKEKLVNVQKEHDALTSLIEYVRIQKDVLEQQQQLMEVNLRLWFLLKIMVMSESASLICYRTGRFVYSIFGFVISKWHLV
jgi:hypothetical protein